MTIYISQIQVNLGAFILYYAMEIYLSTDFVNRLQFHSHSDFENRLF